MNYYLKKYINKNLVPSLKENEKVFKQVNLEEDIDESKSDYYIIDKETGTLEIIFSKENKNLLNYGGHFIDNLEYSERNIVMIPKVNLLNEHNKKFYDGISIFNLNYKKNESEIIRLLFNVENLSLQDGLVIDFSNFIYDCGWVLLDDFNKKFEGKRMKCYLNISQEEEGITVSSCEFFKYLKLKEGSSKEKSVEYFLDLKNNLLYRNRKKYKILSSLRDYKKCNLGSLINLSLHFYRTLSIDKDSITPASNKGLCLNRNFISVGEKKGYIYLKPIKVDINHKFKIEANYKGNIDVEIYDNRFYKWRKIALNNRYCIYDRNIFLRFSMGSDEKLYSICFISSIE